ncbi:mitochondrial protein [Kwoniella heveanensis BCC8398]|uniref:Mitochondrial protein n=1 Tax=Kwoniella heveanensis BCC8398 TaxID=1296120 RepID=A0A1B9H2I8_9TREE|nr:mitochondrial protein [Kwoniella heveanensis BCC8398]
MPPAPTLTQIQSLYNSTITAASRFTSYNFHNYFLRRTDRVFKPVLDSLSPPPGSEVTAKSPDLNALSKFYEEQTKELEVIKRAAEVNRMFEGPKLVVEHARPITSGGGAGMEASAGGGGQPV